MDSDPGPVSAGRAIDRLCDEFAAACRAGLRPRLEDFLARGEESCRPDLLVELLREEVEHLGTEAPPPIAPALLGRTAYVAISSGVMEAGISSAIRASPR